MPAIRAGAGAGGGAWTTGGAAGRSWGLLGKSSKLRPVTEALSSGFFTTRVELVGLALLFMRDTSPFDLSDMLTPDS